MDKSPERPERPESSAGPADAARRALRAARRRQPPAAAPRKPSRSTRVPARPPEETNRPSAAARDALRRARSARYDDRTADGAAGDVPPGTGTPEDTAAGPTPRSPRNPGGTAPAEASPGGSRPPAPARPAHAARGALRAGLARREERTAPPRRKAATRHGSRDASAALPDHGPHATPPESPAPDDRTADDRAPGDRAAGSRPPKTGPPAQPPAAPAASAALRVPPTMASPHRDGELRRTFPAFEARTAGDGRFAETWWGNAWITALEKSALDAARLARGRAYAEAGHVDAITVTPGLVLAYVRGSRPRPYRAQVRLRTLDDADWDRFLDAAAERPGHIAALLDKEMPRSLADCGVPLLPGPGDLEPHCSCPDRGHPCKHAAALCYQTARLLDADPFVLLLLRGRGERGLLDALSRRNAARAARAAQEREPEPLPGVRASDVLDRQAQGHLPPPPAPLPPPPHPGQPPAYPAAPGGPDPFALDQLATDAAVRAHALLTTGRDPVGGLTLWQDAVRLAAARPGSGLTAATRSLYAALASATGRTPADLARAVAAWRQGGPEGLAVLEEPWDPPAGRFDRARPLLLAAGLPAFRPWRNRLTHPCGHLQLRLGRDGLWYAYESEPGRDDWWPRGTPDPDPVGALTGLGLPGDLDDLDDLGDL
ncbi:SWIM zinc finger family protein [Streptomyces thermogriseus]|uniref:SWIM-type domain-containing protein n=1 Tax=Streptomyces thermogriseus TaxID=75292 RepID=A0ABP4DLP0_9ACTN